MCRWDEDVCAQDRTHGKADTCNGDSGGPMTVQENFRSTLVGVTSRSLWRGCPNPYPHVYVRVTEERSWILRTAPGTQDSDCGTFYKHTLTFLCRALHFDVFRGWS